MVIPLFKGDQVCDIYDVVEHNLLNPRIYTENEWNVSALFYIIKNKMPGLLLIFPAYRSSRCYGSKFQTTRPYESPLPSEEYGFLV